MLPSAVHFEGTTSIKAPCYTETPVAKAMHLKFFSRPEVRSLQFVPNSFF
jgi:hypothetical protein